MRKIGLKIISCGELTKCFQWITKVKKKNKKNRCVTGNIMRDI